MAGESEMAVRLPAVAGSFYPAQAQECRAQARAMLRARPEVLSGTVRCTGAIVPHAGWIFSGAIAGESIATLARQGPVDVVVVFGAIHTPLHAEVAVLDSHARWQVPG